MNFVWLRYCHWRLVISNLLLACVALGSAVGSKHTGALIVFTLCLIEGETSINVEPNVEPTFKYIYAGQGEAFQTSTLVYVNDIRAMVHTINYCTHDTTCICALEI